MPRSSRGWPHGRIDTSKAFGAVRHGYSSKEPWEGENRVTNQAAAYVDLLHVLGYQKAVYEGESMGAFIGFEIGMRYPETLDKVILNGFGIVDMVQKEFKKQPYKGDLFELSKAAVLDPSYENIQKRLHWLVHDNDSIDDEAIAIRQKVWSEPEINKSLRRIFGIDGGRLQESYQPYTEDEVKARWKSDAMVIYGELNPGRGPDYGQYCADLIGAKFYEFKGAGHWPMWETPDEYVEVIRSYINS